ncbi:MAG: hypothetical protein QXH25_03320 [Acidilobaceae archaeon]
MRPMPKLWKCQVCALVLEVESPPERCPRCGAPREQFKELAENEVQLILRSRLTNSLHMRALTLLEELKEIAEKGIRDNLDPLCLKIFQKEKEFAELTIQEIKAELEVHMKKGKWG